jgi:hypothetical protein
LTTDNLAPTALDRPRPDEGAIWRELYRAYADFYREAITEEQGDLVWSGITDPTTTSRHC